MLTPRTSVLFIILLTCIAAYLYFFNDVSFFSVHFDEGDDGPARPPRPNYPPFRPPPIEDSPPPPPFQLDGSKPDPHRHPEDTAWPEGQEDASRHLWLSRGEAVKQAFLHAYRGYEKYAPFPADELRPLSHTAVTNFNGWGVTMVDSLDTMWLMGLKEEFDHARGQVAAIDFSMSSGYAPFFETVIRYLGGLLSAYALSKDPIMLSRAEELGRKLLPVFDTPSGLPTYGVNPQTGDKTHQSTVLLAEIASCQMEYKYLAHVTGRAEFFKAADKVMDVMARTQPTHGMWPTHFSTQNGEPNLNGQFAVGALADSAYEYLLKQYLLSGKTEERLAKMYMKAMTGIIDNLILISPTRNLVYVTDAPYGMHPSRKFEHLTCFFPGLLALGADTLPPSIMTDKERQRHKWAAEAVGHACWVMYADQLSGLGPEAVLFDSWPSTEAGWQQEKWITQVEKWEKEGKKSGKFPGIDNADMPFHGKVPAGKKKDYFNQNDNYLLRPETLESMFVLWRTTKDQKWRDHGWEIWDAIEKKTRTDSGYASQNGVSGAKPVPQESMPSYFLAETIKYAYLLTQDNDPLPESAYVLNTEAHPLPVFTWADWERKEFNVKS